MTLDLAALTGETGLSWPELPTFEQWADLGPRLASLHNVSRWALADWLCTGEDLFEAKADQVTSQLGLAFHTLENLRWVARRVPPSVRQPLPVSFSHHALVATLPPTTQQRLLADCHTQGWTREEFRDYLLGQGLIPDTARHEDWRLEAGAAIEDQLWRWIRQSELLPSRWPHEVWSRERETLVLDLLKVVERFRR
jgi:hypothetical protein